MASAITYPNPVQATANVQALLEELHRLSSEQEAKIRPGHAKFVSTDAMNHTGDTEDEASTASAVPASSLPGFRQDMSDKFIALDQDKCWFVYQLLLSMGATKVVEAGTSFGDESKFDNLVPIVANKTLTRFAKVSTIYLALAVRQNAARQSPGAKGLVIATEHEESKAKQAQEYWQQCGAEVRDQIDLRIGDLLETLKINVPQDIDLLLLDIWTPLALPTLKLILPHLKKGSVVITDNSIGGANGYKELLKFLQDRQNGFTNTTLPFTGGLEMSVYIGAPSAQA